MFQNAITLYEKRNKQRYTGTCAHTGISPHFEAWMIMKEGECEVWHCLYTGCDLMISLGSCCDRWDTVIKSVPCKWQSHKSFSSCSCHNELIDQVIIQAFLKNKSIVLEFTKHCNPQKHAHHLGFFRTDIYWCAQVKGQREESFKGSAMDNNNRNKISHTMKNAAHSLVRICKEMQHCFHALMYEPRNQMKT